MIALCEAVDEHQKLAIFSAGDDRFIGCVQSGSAEPGRTFGVEFDLPEDELRLLSTPALTGLKIDGDATVFSGIIEDIQPDGVLFFRVRRDCLIMLELSLIHI